MKAALVVLVVVLAASVINWMRGSEHNAPIVQSLPFLGGHPPSIYDLAALILLPGMLLWGLARLRGRGASPDEAERARSEETEQAEEAQAEEAQAEEAPAEDEPQETEQGVEEDEDNA